MNSNIRMDVYPQINIIRKADGENTDLTISAYVRLKFDNIWYLSKCISGITIESADDIEINESIKDQLMAFNKMVYINLICSEYDPNSFIDDEPTYIVDDNQEEEAKRIQQLITNRYF